MDCFKNLMSTCFKNVTVIFIFINQVRLTMKKLLLQLIGALIVIYVFYLIMNKFAYAFL